jgi:putative SOS response-associated peptidase YedK
MWRRAIRARFNIAPTDQHFIVTSEFERRRVHRARWGLVNRRATDNRRASQCINAKAETLEQRATFREAFQQRPCVVPADTEVTFTIVTCAANPVIGEIHDRMP